MTLAEALLQKLARWRPDNGRQTLEVTSPEAGWVVALTAGQVEVLGCRLWDITLKRQGELPPLDLDTRAREVASRVTGLLEPLRLLEVDQARGEALLRSDSPGRWGEGLFYYEVLLRADGVITLRRYQAPSKEEP